MKLNTGKIFVFDHVWLSSTLVYHCMKTFNSIP